jgi:hypothetical protein
MDLALACYIATSSTGHESTPRSFGQKNSPSAPVPPLHRPIEHTEVSLASDLYLNLAPFRARYTHAFLYRKLVDRLLFQS